MRNRITVIVCITVLLIAGIAAIVVLELEHDDTTQMIELLVTSIIPTVTGLFAFKEASAANANAGQAVQNTNGLLHSALKLSPDDPATRQLLETIPEPSNPITEGNPS